MATSRPSLLWLSLAANLVLAGVVAAQLWHGRAAAPARLAPTTRPAPTQAAVSHPAAPACAATASAGDGNLNSDTIAQLEQLGIPRQTLVSVVVEDHNRRSAEAVLALQKKYAPRLVPASEMRELARQQQAEQLRAIKEAFGEDGFREWDKEQTLRTLNRARPPGDELPLSPAESEQAYQLQKEYDERFAELQQAMEDGVADRADSAALQAQAQENLDRALLQLLGRQRFDALRGNADPTVEVFRSFGDLNPSPEQAQAVVQADTDFRARQEALNALVRDNPGTTTNLLAELQAIDEARTENLREIFGAAAYDALQRQNDPTYQSLTQFADAWGLQPQEVQSTYAAIRAFEEQANRLRTAAEMSEAAGQRVNWREITARIEQQRQQAEARLQNLLGSRRLARLQENGLLARH